MRSRSLALLFAASLLCASPLLVGCEMPASAQEGAVASGDLALLVSATRSEVAVGEDFEFSIRVENRGKSPIAVRAIRLSSHSAFLELSEGGYERPVHHLLRYPGGIPNIEPADQTQLAPGESLSGTLVLPAVEVGSFDVRVGYTGTFPFPIPEGQEVAPRYSDSIHCKVVPSASGAVRLQALMKTNHGQVRLRFYNDTAPGTVANFVTLARGGFYKGLTFHRIIKDFMIQGGDPDGTGGGGPGYSIPAEFSSRYPHKPGALAMARTQYPHSAGCQFYVCLGSPSHLDGQYTIFGQVVEGQSVIDALGAIPTGAGDVPKTPALIETLSIEGVDAEGKPCALGAAEPEGK